MKSKIYLEEEIENTERKFGSARSYNPVMIVDRDGNETPGMMTRAMIKDMEKRAARNPEDVPGETFWRKLFG
ncbi:MAG: hypothetical protein KAH06_05400 [Desulfobacterales bacterium]|nr:hypothetical protein [Desulfobacterales bacterium]